MHIFNMYPNKVQSLNNIDWKLFELQITVCKYCLAGTDGRTEKAIPRPSTTQVKTPITYAMFLKTPVTYAMFLKTPITYAMFLKTPDTYAMLLKTPDTYAMFLKHHPMFLVDCFVWHWKLVCAVNILLFFRLSQLA